MNDYLHLVHRVLHTGRPRADRTGIGTYSLFGEQLQLRADNPFPLLGARLIRFRTVAAETCFFLRGKRNIEYLRGYGVRIWDAWAKNDGDLGPIYGVQWRRWMGRQYMKVQLEHDQITGLIAGLKSDPHSRRHVVSAWNVADLGDMALPPCHMLFQCYVEKGLRLSLRVDMRSCDVFIGLPHNIASYALILHWLCAHTGYIPGRLIFQFGDLHLYANHLEQAEQLLEAGEPPDNFPVLEDVKPVSPDDICPDDFQLTGYKPNPPIKAPVAI